MAAAAAAADWLSLPSDLVDRIADIFLDIGDLDYYMSLRAVCHNWRACIDDPRGSDPRFRPHGWIMLTGDGPSGRCLFLHVHTGRFLWMDLPTLRNYVTGVPTTDGLLALQPAAIPGSKICLLNPFTGYHIPYPSVTMSHYDGRVIAAGTSPVLLYLWDRRQSAVCIDPTDGFEWVTLFSANAAVESFHSVAVYQGRPYVADEQGAIAVVEDHSGRDPRLTTLINAYWNERVPTFLVSFFEEVLFLVRTPTIEGNGMLEVLRVDVENKELWTVGNIANFAIFVGDRCVFVDADKLPGIEGNCVYYIGGGARPSQRGVCMHRLKDGGHEKLFEDIAPELRPRPLTLAQALMNYTQHSWP